METQVSEAAAPEAGVEAKVAELTQALERAREALDAAERRHSIDLELIRAEAMDLETARVMTELAVAQMDSADVARAVSDLKRRKPFLFRRGVGGGGGGVMAPEAPGRAGDERGDLARQAASTGDRTVLLRYLRAKRSAS